METPAEAGDTLRVNAQPNKRLTDYADCAG